MRPQTSGFGFGGGGFAAIPRVTKAMLIAFVSLSLGNQILGGWLGLVSIADWLVFRPADVLRGELWRLLTWPFLEVNLLGFLIGGFIFYLYASRLEALWGERRFLRRVAILVLVPSVLTVLIGLFVPRVGGGAWLGTWTLTIALLTAAISPLRSQQTQLWPIPIVLTGDTLLMIIGGIMFLSILFSGTVAPHVPVVISFAFALAWFRFDMGRDLRQTWLRMKKRRIEAKLNRLRRKRGLRVVSEDDDESPRRYLN